MAEAASGWIDVEKLIPGMRDPTSVDSKLLTGIVIANRYGPIRYSCVKAPIRIGRLRSIRVLWPGQNFLSRSTVRG